MAKGMDLKTLLKLSEPTTGVKDLAFEEGMLLLEELVASVESGTLPLDTAIRSYECGAALLDHLRGLLGGAEVKLKTLSKDSKGELAVS